MNMKINERGQITIPKELREKYALLPGIKLTVEERDGKILLQPSNFCPSCKKALPDGESCPDCPPPKTTYVY